VSENPNEMALKEALQFLIDLAEIENPSTLRGWQRVKLAEDLAMYLGVEGEGAVSAQIGKIQEHPETVTPTISAARDLLNAAADKEPLKGKLGAMEFIFKGDEVGTGRSPVLWSGSLADIFVQQALSDLGDAKSWQIVRCPECHRIFLARRKGQKFCSPYCSTKVAIREHYAKKGRQKGKNAKKGGKER